MFSLNKRLYHIILTYRRVKHFMIIEIKEVNEKEKFE
jgi:hypothetical protein